MAAVSGEPIRRIVILGGGTAGWMTAAYLDRALNGGCKGRPPVDICLIESDDIGIIGVGEATIPSLRQTMSFLGVGEHELMRATNASFKTAIKFTNWLDDPPRDPDGHYYHPFGQQPAVSRDYRMELAHAWAAERRTGRTPQPFAHMVGPTAALCDALRAPKTADSKPYIGHVHYAYHLDAVLLGRLLRRVAVERGVRRIVDTVIDVLPDERGHVRALRTAKSGDVAGELFVDCSGFAGLLINRFLREPFVGYGEGLLCDRAVAMQVPAPTQKTINPFTTSAAKSAGWIWEIHLQGRLGIGYVYGSAFISDDDAEEELRRHIGAASQGLDARRLKMKVGRNERLWVGNVVAIGLSGGFIEPLESSGIYLIEAGIQKLLEYFPTADFPATLSRRYNAVVGELYDNIRDFIVLHYCLTRREDTAFWRANRHSLHRSDRLSENLELWEHKLPTIGDVRSSIQLYGAHGYVHIMSGMDHLSGAVDLAAGAGAGGHMPGRLRPEEVVRVRASIAQATKTSLSLCPDHARYLAAMRAKSGAGDTVSFERTSQTVAHASA